MTIELLISSKISLEEASEHSQLIQDIFYKRLGPPNIKPTKTITFFGKPVLRAKIDKGSRIFFNWEKDDDNNEILHLITINTKHKYKEVKRELEGVNPKKSTLITFENEPSVKEEKQPLDLEQTKPSEWAILSNDKIIIPDEEQKKALKKLSTPVAFTGPPGAGKTTVLYNAMILTLKKEREAAEQFAVEVSLEDEIPVKNPEKIFFFSHSPNLLTKLEGDAKTHPGIPAITFTSWVNLLLKKNPGKQLIAENAFAEWFSTQKCTLAEKVPAVIHYELSLIAAFGFEKYKELGERQCYYAKASTAKKNELNKLLIDWLEHLEKNQLVDPMVSTIPDDQAEDYDRVFCDETQNLPPVALRYLIQHTPKQGFASSLDSEQCLTLSPYIENCLQTLMFTHYGKYSLEHLPRSYRCSAAVAKIASFVMQRKRQLDGKHERRNYQEIKSALDIEGVVSWIDKNNFKKLDDHCKDPETAVLIPDNTSPEEILRIKKALNTDYILRYSDAIGLDLKNVILWKPFSQVKAFKNLNKQGDNAIPDGLTLAQWQAFNALYMAITRAQEGVYVYEEEPFYKNLGEFILGEIPKNKILSAKKLTKEELTQKLKQAIEIHLNQNQFEIARNLMVKLDQSDKETKDTMEASQPLKHSPEPVVAQPAKIVEQKNRKTRNRKTKAFPAKDTAPKPILKLESFQEMLVYYNYILRLLATKDPRFLIPLFQHKNLIKFLFEIPIIDEDDHANYDSLFLRLITDITWSEKTLQLTFDNLQTSPKLREKFSERFLFEVTGDNIVPMFIFLIESKLGLSILINLLENNPKIAEKINAKILYANYRSDEEIYLSAFNVLSESTLGIELFCYILLFKQELVEQVPGKLLCDVPTFKEAGISYQKSPLLWFLFHNNDLTRLTIRQFTETNPNWVKNLTPAVLCNLCPLEVGVFANTSVLYWLVKNDLGFLKQLIGVNPNLLRGITAEAFYTNQENFSVFLGLVTSGLEGLELLNMILALNPNLIQGAIRREIYTRICQTLSGRECSIFSELNRTTLGQEILKKLEPLLGSQLSGSAKIAAQIGLFKLPDTTDKILSSSMELNPSS